MLALLSDYIYQYELKPECNNDIKATKSKVLTQSTIAKFCSIHGNTYRSCFYQISEALQDIRHHEKVILFEGEKIYYHTYCILTLLSQYLIAIDYYYSDKYKKTLAGLRGSEEQILDKFHYHKANALDDSNAFTGDDRVKAAVFYNLYRDRETTSLFLNFFTYFPLHMIKIDDVDQWCTPILQKIIEHFSSTYIASEEIIYKSLAIRLNSYLRVIMRVKSVYAKQITQEILDDLFKYKFSATSADLSRNVYIAGRLDSIPIFKHGKEPHKISDKTINKFDAFIKEIYSEFGEVRNLQITAKEFLKMDMVKLFLSHKPVEFLQEKQ